MNLLKSLAAVSSMTMRVIVRHDAIVAYFWRRDGDRRLFVAFKPPNLLRRIFAEGAFLRPCADSR